MRRSPVAFWHLLSLDAPSVAALWTWFAARCCGVQLPSGSIVAMFLAVWILYAADRLLDGLNGAATQLEERHHFHHRHRRLFVMVIALAAVALAALVPSLSAPAVRLYGLLGALLAGWFLLIHTRLAHERRLPKELAVGVFFAAAVFIPTVARRPQMRGLLVAPAILFAAVCTLNCMYVYAWEHPRDRANASITTRFVTRRLGVLAPAALATNLLLAAWMFAATHRDASTVWAIPAACAISAALLLILHARRESIDALHLRAAADLALLTPVLLLPWLGMAR